jgi:hypothetical protein
MITARSYSLEVDKLAEFDSVRLRQVRNGKFSPNGYFVHMDLSNRRNQASTGPLDGNTKSLERVPEEPSGACYA